MGRIIIFMEAIRGEMTTLDPTSLILFVETGSEFGSRSENVKERGPSSAKRVEADHETEWA